MRRLLTTITAAAVLVASLAACSSGDVKVVTRTVAVATVTKTVGPNDQPTETKTPKPPPSATLSATKLNYVAIGTEHGFIVQMPEAATGDSHLINNFEQAAGQSSNEIFAGDTAFYSSDVEVSPDGTKYCQLEPGTPCGEKNVMNFVVRVTKSTGDPVAVVKQYTLN